MIRGNAPLRRFALLATSFGVLLAAQLPASWVNRASPSANVFLAEAQGTLWSGKGVVWITADVAQTGRPLMPLAWQFEPGGLLNLELRWRLQSGDAHIATLYLGSHTLGVRQLQTKLPASVVATLSSGPVARFGWRGDLALTAPHWECNWQGQQCTGFATVLWQGAASDLLPIRALGDYQLTASAQRENTTLQWHTLRGEIQTRGEARLSGGRLQINGSIAGNPEWLAKLPNIAQGWVQPGQKPGEYLLALTLPVDAP